MNPDLPGGLFADKQHLTLSLPFSPPIILPRASAPTESSPARPRRSNAATTPNSREVGPPEIPVPICAPTRALTASPTPESRLPNCAETVAGKPRRGGRNWM